MEPIDIDKIIKDKIEENNDVHEHDREAAKPFIWSAIQNQLNRKKGVTWYHLAAAVLVLLITFTFVLYRAQRGHRSELHQLSEKIDRLESNYLAQAELAQNKDVQIDQLKKELKHVDQQFTHLNDTKQEDRHPIIIYRTDTVFIKQTEYLAVAPDTSTSKQTNMAELTEPDQKTEVAQLPEKKRDDVIFPGNSPQEKQAESIKFRFGSFAATKN